MGVMKMLFGNYSKRELKRIQPICDQVLALEDKYKAMSDSELQAQTPALKERWQKVKHWMIFCLMPLPPAEKLLLVY